MNFFQFLIPKAKAQVVTELESWTVTWKFYSGEGWGMMTTKSKVLISELEVGELKTQLRQCAEFIGCIVEVKSYKN